MGHADGSMSHYKVEKGDLYFTLPPGLGRHAGSAIVHMSWVEGTPPSAVKEGIFGPIKV